MTTQLGLLADTPVARNSDPGTSHAAGRKATRTNRATQQHLMRKIVNERPGHTSAELASLYKLDRHMVGRRLPELRPKYLKNGETRKCKATGNPSMTWYPV